MRQLDAEHMSESEQEDLEKKIMLQSFNPFLLKLEFVFQSEHKIFFVSQYQTRGNLYDKLQRAKRFSEAKAKNYAAQIISAISSLHSEQCVHKDLRLENFVVC